VITTMSLSSLGNAKGLVSASLLGEAGVGAGGLSSSGGWVVSRYQTILK